MVEEKSRVQKVVEKKPRRLKVLEELSKFTEPAGATEIAGIIGESSLNGGNDLYYLGKGGLARKPDEKQSLWLITENGKKYIEHPSAQPSAPSSAPPGPPPPEPRLLHSDVHGLPHWTPLSQL